MHQIVVDKAIAFIAIANLFDTFDVFANFLLVGAGILVSQSQPIFYVSCLLVALIH